jgi:hypothetical protein
VNESIKKSFEWLAEAIEKKEDLDTLRRRTDQLLREIEKFKEKLCNKCGESCKKSWDHYGLIDAVVVGGYESDGLEDMKA